jgi:eukaryotic-like serine/threonine-protein kinase
MEARVLYDMPQPGSTVGPWLLLDRMGSGSYGVVFRARRAGHPEAPPVALKMAKTPRDPRFLREAELLQHGHHPGKPRYEDQGLWTSPEGLRHPYVVMELIEGLTLYDWFLEQPRSSREFLSVLAQVAGALADAHARGAVHRDVKGDNIRVTAAGRAVLVDWGSGWFAGASPLTDTTAPPGTNAYRPPEQKAFMWRFRMDAEARWRSQPSDDLYALGVALYRCVTGVYMPPCTEGGVPVEQEVLPPSDMATVCPELEAITLRLLSEDRQSRGTAEQLAREAVELAQTAGPEADRPILPTSSALPTEEGRQAPPVSSGSEELSDTDRAISTNEPGSDTSNQRERRRRFPPFEALISTALAAMVGGLVVVLAMELLKPRIPEPEPVPWLSTPEELAPFSTDGGVAENALSSVENVPSAGVPHESLGRPMPSKPFPTQRKPPCDDGETAIHGGCWVRVWGREPPCGQKMFDYEKGCYKPSVDMPRTPTAREP